MDPKTPANPPSPVQPSSAPPASPAPTATTIGAPGTVDPSATIEATSTATAGSGEATLGTRTRNAEASAARSASAKAAGFDRDARSDAMRALLAQNWWAVALRGAFAILFGLVALFAPGPTLLSLALFFAAYLLVDGIFGIVAAVRAAARQERWGLLLLEGIANLAMGAVAALFPVSAVLAFVIVTAAWALLTGGLMVAAAFRLDKHHGRWWLALGGAVSVVFGVLLLLSPLIGAVVLTWWLGAYALAFGAMLLGLAFKLKSRREARGSLPRETASVGAR
jgi:uncharacterized membrane protein HdeD (DUF308 family)